MGSLELTCKALIVQHDEATLFIRDGESYIATELARGPWDRTSCHGGPIAALLARSCEQFGAGEETSQWQLARVTVELLRPVPVLEPLLIETVSERPGRKVSLVGTSLATPKGIVVAKARALRIRSLPVALTETFVPEPSFSEAGGGVVERPTWADAFRAFHRDAVELRFTDGRFTERGPVALWCRLTHPLFAGETPSGAQRAAACADFSNGVSSELDPADYLYINPDLTVHLLRAPEGE
ncbi:MAG: thioesterase family protein, partial [Ilumatobacteraceae bacterium]